MNGVRLDLVQIPDFDGRGNGFFVISDCNEQIGRLQLLTVGGHSLVTLERDGGVEVTVKHVDETIFICSNECKEDS